MGDRKHISDELLARYLENNVSDFERQIVHDFLEENQEEMDAFLIAAQEIAFQEMEKRKSVGVYSKSLLEKELISDDVRYQMAGHGEVKMAADSKTIEAGCAIQAQQLILSKYGISVSTNELFDVARMNGWFMDKLGSPLDYVGELLNHYQIPAVQMRNANIYHLINELSQGHQVIVGVDVNDLSLNEKWHRYDEVMCGKEANHVLIVAGIDTKDPKNPKIILSDPSRPDAQKIYSAKQFMNAWEDSGFFMVATTQPAPLQYNPEMKYFDYNAGHIKKIADIAYTEIVKRLADEGYIVKKDTLKPYQRFLLFLGITICLLLGALFTWMYFSPFNMKIMFHEDSSYKIPALPFEDGTLTISFEDMKTQTFRITKENLSCIIPEIEQKYRGEQAHIRFKADRFQTIDTIIKIQKNLNFSIKHDQSLSCIFGTVISAIDGKPIPDVKIQVQDIQVQTDPTGYFKIQIPFSKQNKIQTLKASKEGYQLWRGTYEPSLTNGWDIVLQMEK
ncbi:MAG: hypothetical protein H6Q25_1468 [Bacteroidetes bacterium]|nr:hypothetical protein [Bacteroidota bacterium]